ncbi:MAG: hypothetical protein HY692_08340 [Cyanobacteria bacterium NC_groundwater_1444_Ag_S-0.65um_54_12]|nr:hypothetical protein [Cyanobacteria bacterium NC_groundwater_1444_Ag_S-0.65um_54_12]
MSAVVGSSIMLYGNFDPTASNNLVRFNGAMALELTVNPTGTQLTVTVPSNATSGPLTVQVGNLLTLATSWFKVIIPGTTIDLVAGTTIPPAGTLPTDWPMTWPSAMAQDNLGNLLISVSDGDVVYRIAADGTLTLAAGNGIHGFAGDGGPATQAQLGFPYGIAVDGTGNLYIADQDNQRIRRVDSTTGIITTVAGNGSYGFAGDGGVATAAQFRDPRSVTVDGAGNLYIADQVNQRIRKVNAAGVITTVAGNGSGGYSGDGGAATSAKLWMPRGVTVDGAGNLYIADQFNYRIRKVNTGGIINTVAGNGTWGYSGDGGPATSAQLNVPNGVAVDSAGNLYIADANFGNNLIRRVSY